MAGSFKITVNKAKFEKTSRELGRMLNKLPAAMERSLDDILFIGANKMRNESIKLIQSSPATGRTYEKYQPRRTHISSSPGQAPRTDLGTLLASISARKGKKGGAEFVASAAHAAALEKPKKHKDRKRPFMKPAFDSVIEQLMVAIKDGLRADLKRIARSNAKG